MGFTLHGLSRPLGPANLVPARLGGDNRTMFQRPSTFKPLVPDVPSVSRALEKSETLSSIMDRLRASQACLAVVKAQLPPAMAAHIKSGAIDHEGWTILAPNAAASAKLRQLVPRFMAALNQKGLSVPAIRVKVQSYESL